MFTKFTNRHNNKDAVVVKTDVDVERIKREIIEASRASGFSFLRDGLMLHRCRK